jgi:hypothetical protein
MQPCQSPVRKSCDCALHVAVAPCEVWHLGREADLVAGLTSVLVAPLSLTGRLMAVGLTERNPVRGDFLAWEPPSWGVL